MQGGGGGGGGGVPINGIFGYCCFVMYIIFRFKFVAVTILFGAVSLRLEKSIFYCMVVT